MTLKSLKRAIAIIMCALCIVSGITVCSAASQEYTVSELDEMSITLPDGMSAITRNSNSSEKYFSVFGLDYDTTMNNFKNSDIYLQGMDDSSTLTLTVSMTKTEESQGIKNYNLLDNEELSEVEGNFLNQNEYSSCTPDQSEDNKILWLLFSAKVTAGGTSISAYQAHTVYDGMSVNITLQRNGSNVTAADYEVFSQVVSTVSFGRESSLEALIPVIIVGGAAVVIILVVILVIAVKRAAKKGKKSKNDKIISELADKYKLRENEKSKGRNKRKKTSYDDNEDSFDEFVDISFYDNSANSEGSDYIDSRTFEDNLEEQLKQDYLGETEPDDVRIYDKNKPDTVVSDEEIDEILNSARSFESDSDKIVYFDDAQKESDDDVSEDNISQDYETDTSVQEETYNQHIEEADYDTEEPDKEELDLTEDGLTEVDEFNNDEELVRSQAKRIKFSDSDDFFEEAPKRTMGIISNKELDEAEDYDVINEIEQRAARVEIESEDVDAGVPIDVRIKKIGKGFKSFGIHLGYFCTNVYRLIKRKRAIAKRKKAEEERRERARIRAERQRRQRRAEENGSLVKVHGRNDGRTSQSSVRSSQRRTISSNQTRRRPNNNRR